MASSSGGLPPWDSEHWNHVNESLRTFLDARVKGDFKPSYAFLDGNAVADLMTYFAMLNADLGRDTAMERLFRFGNEVRNHVLKDAVSRQELTHRKPMGDESLAKSMDSSRIVIVPPESVRSGFRFCPPAPRVGKF